MTMGDISPETIARFWSKVNVARYSGCWTWRGYIGPGGYAKFRINGKTKQAHRVAYFLFNGRIDESLDVRHTCDNPKCVNPHHLMEGTTAENIWDMVRKGRHRSGRQDGEDNPVAKLSCEEVREIRRRCGLGEKDKDLATEFGVSHSQICKIRLRKCWRVDADQRNGEDGKVRYALPEMREA